jgi:hypothetical protein
METMKEYVIRRHIDIKLHNPILDEENKTVTYLIWNLSGKLVGYQQNKPYAPKIVENVKDKKYYNYTSKGELAVWGLESVKNDDGVIYLTEGIYDAARLTEKGKTALAVCGNDPRHLRNWISLLQRPIVSVCDNDSAGRKLAKYGDYSEIIPVGKDLGDSSEHYVNWLINKYS